jgi:hypothetical protein
MARAMDCAILLASYTVLPFLDQRLSAQSLYLSFATRRQAGLGTRRDCAGRTINGLLMMRTEFRLVQLFELNHE